MELISRRTAKQEGVDEARKASDRTEWAASMNNIRNRAEEIVLSEMIYSDWFWGGIQDAGGRQPAPRAAFRVFFILRTEGFCAMIYSVQSG